MQRISVPYISLWLPALIGLLLLPVPLLGNFHIESALLAALVGCFWAGVSASSLRGENSDWNQISFILGQLYLVGLPLLCYAIFTGCFSWSGFDFWVLYPIPSVLFGYSFGRMLRLWSVPYRRWITILFLLFVAIGILLIEFFNLPQVYFFNNVWGGWPGPIYDETVTVSWSLVFFRGITLLWTILFWLLPLFKKSKLAKSAIFSCVFGLIMGYSFFPKLGITSPPRYIQKQLGGVKETSHFIIYYAKTGFTPSEINMVALEHEFYFQQIVKKLNLNEDFYNNKKIESYLYATARQKNKYTGAKFTSYVPVWLEEDQLHIAKQQLGSLKHELVHVLAKQFGNRLLNANWSIGLVEGLAVALAGNVSSRSTIHQIVAAEKPWPDVSQMKNVFSFLGFYGGRSTVNYTTTGSFVRYLLNHYPVSAFKKAYGSSDFEQAYPQPFGELVNGWHQFLETVVVDSLDQQVAARLFSIPSIFEQACPHVLTPMAQHLQDYRYYLTVKDSVAALGELGTLRKLTPNNKFIENRWMFLNLKLGHINDVLALDKKQMDIIPSKLLYTDALALNGEWEKAALILKNAATDIDSISYIQQQNIIFRQKRFLWQNYLDLVYNNHFINVDDFNQLNYFLQILTIKEAIVHERRPIFSSYAYKMVDKPLNAHFFDVYLEISHYLAFHQKFALNLRYTNKLSKLPLRKRYKQRLQEEKHWLKFLKSQKK